MSPPSPAGSTRYNAQLSKRRADAVKDFLVAQGLNDGLLKTVGMGESRQVRPGAAKDAEGAELGGDGRDGVRAVRVDGPAGEVQADALVDPAAERRPDGDADRRRRAADWLRSALVRI